MELTQSVRNFKLVASVLGIVQGLTWGIMAFICVVLYLKEGIPLSVVAPTTYMEIVDSYIYQLFLMSNLQMFPNQTMTGGVFHGFMWVYFIENMIWLGASIYLLRKNDFKIIRQWSQFTIIMCLFDFLLFVILGADYSKCISSFQGYGGILNPTELILGEAICANAILPVFVIAAKGFTLWIFNIAIAVIMYKISYTLKI